MLVFGNVTVKKCEQFSSIEYDSLSARMIVPNCEVSVSHDAVSARPLASEELSGVDHEKCQQCIFFFFFFFFFSSSLQLLDSIIILFLFLFCLFSNGMGFLAATCLPARVHPPPPPPPPPRVKQMFNQNSDLISPCTQEEAGFTHLHTSKYTAKAIFLKFCFSYLTVFVADL